MSRILSFPKKLLLMNSKVIKIYLSMVTPILTAFFRKRFDSLTTSVSTVLTPSYISVFYLCFSSAGLIFGVSMSILTGVFELAELPDKFIQSIIFDFFGSIFVGVILTGFLMLWLRSLAIFSVKPFPCSFQTFDRRLLSVFAFWARHFLPRIEFLFLLAEIMFLK